MIVTAQHQPLATPNTPAARCFSLLMIAAGITGWCYNWHLASTEGQIHIAGNTRWRPDARAHGVGGTPAARQHARSQGGAVQRTNLYGDRIRNRLTPALSAASGLTFLQKNYHLGSFNQK